MKLNKQCRWW